MGTGPSTLARTSVSSSISLHRNEDLTPSSRRTGTQSREMIYAHIRFLLFCSPPFCLLLRLFTYHISLYPFLEVN